MRRKIFKWLGYFWLGALILLGVVYVYLAVQIGEKAAERAVFKREDKSFLVFAHRGGGGLFPENTLGAFEYSAKMNVDVLELDVRGTSDGKLVVIHDAAVDRTTNSTGKISEMTLEEIKKLDAGYSFSTDGGQTFPFRGKGITIPTLEEIFAAFPEMTFNVEPKQETPSITESLCQIIGKTRMTDKTIVGSFRQNVIDEFRQQCSQVATSATPSEAITFLTLSKLGLSESYSPPMQALQVPEKLSFLEVVSPKFVENAHKRNLKVHVWTINDSQEMQKLIEMGVDGIMTDYPDRLLKLLNHKKQIGN